MKVALCSLFLFCSSSLCAQNPRLPVPSNPGSSNRPYWFPTTTIQPPTSNSEPPSPPVAPGSTVSVNQLQIPPRAIKEMQRAQKSFASGDIRGSVQHLEKAVHIDPKIPEVHNDLGQRYCQLLQFDKALMEFRAASSLAPQLVELINNQSVALFALARYPEAESTARQALILDPQHPPTRYILGRILAAENQNTAETIELLSQSRARYVPARLILASVLLKRGQTDDAITELHSYLDLPDAPDKDKVACALAQLTNASAVSACNISHPQPTK
jgi:tetratricopeptide (TPR) repeat protein